MKCLHYQNKHCASCALLSIGYSSSIESKEQKLNDLFPASVDKIKPTLFCDKRGKSSRNKAKLAVAFVGGVPEFGFYDSSMQFKKLTDCPLHHPAINAILPSLLSLIQLF